MDIQFYANVIEMRKWQKEYFQTRSKRSLEQAKYFEREVDKQLAAAAKTVVDTVNMFTDEFFDGKKCVCGFPLVKTTSGACCGNAKCTVFLHNEI